MTFGLLYYNNVSDGDDAKNNVKCKENTWMKKKAMERKMIRTSFRTTLFRNHRCTKEQNENKGNNIAVVNGVVVGKVFSECASDLVMTVTPT